MTEPGTIERQEGGDRTMSKKKRLGRGLDALLSKPAPAAAETAEAPAAAAEAGGDRLRNIPVDLLQRGRYQPRVDMRQESLEDLATSIRAQGVVQPIVARPLDTGNGATRYEIIAGERRWRAAQMAGLAEIPAVIRDVPDEGAIAMALIENIQRENLNPLEEARALDRLIREFELTHQAAADAVGRSRAAVSNLLRLLELSEKVKGLLEARQLEMGHARALLTLDEHDQREIGRQIVAKGLSVRQTETLVRSFQENKHKNQNKTAAAPSADIRRLQEQLSDRLGAGVEIQHTAKGKGKLVINYNSLDELDGILAHIK